MASVTDIFKPDNKTIEQIFGDTEAFYNMPIYQRPYAWDKERVEQLWYDILEAYKNNLQLTFRSLKKCIFLILPLSIKKYRCSGNIQLELNRYWYL